MKKYYIYKITNTVNKKVYIGKTNDLHVRWAAHRSLSRKPDCDEHYLIHRAIAKYAEENFLFEEIESFSVEMEALDREIYWISFYKSNVRRYGDSFGYNLTDGGEGTNGYKHTEETKLWISEYNKNYYATHAHPMLGTHHSEETKHLISESQKGLQVGEKNGFYGKQHTEETKKIMSKKKKEYFFTYPAINLGTKSSDETRAKQRKSRFDNFDHFSEINSGSKNPNAKLTEEDVADIKQLLMSGSNDLDLAKKFGVHHELIGRIRCGKKWAQVIVDGFVPFEREPKREIKLTKEKVREIKRLLQLGTKPGKIATLFSVSYRMIRNIATGKSWTNV